MKIFSASIHHLEFEPYFFREKVIIDHQLIESINQFGILSPIISYKNQIIDGKKRYQVAKNNQLKEVLIIDLENASDLEVFFIYLDLHPQQFGFVQKSKLLNYAKTNFDLESFKSICEKLNLKNKTEVEKLLSLKKLAEEVIEISTEENYSLNWFLAFTKFSLEDQRFIYHRFIDLKPNQNKWIEILDHLDQIKRRDSKEVKEILEIIFQELEEKNYTIDTVREKLYCQKFPRLSKKQHEFDKFIKLNKLTSDLKINSSPYFEDQKVFIQIQSEDSQQLKNQLEKLSKVDWQELYKII